MTIFFRVDASEKIGNGHLVRCMTLAKSLLNHEFIVVFICSFISDSLAQLIVSEKIILEKIDSFVDDLTDANYVINVLDKYSTGLIVVDHYELNIRWHQIISKFVYKIIVIDDLANRPLFCHLLINSGCFNKDAYQMLLPDCCEQMLGPEYVILKPEYLFYKKKDCQEQIKRVFIFMGGADSKNITSKIIEAFSDSTFDSINFDLVIGSSNSRKCEIEKLVASKTNFSIFQNRPHLADLMQKADIAFGAGGATSWERICVGLPSAVITLSENQVTLIKHLNNLGLVKFLGHFDVVTSHTIHEFMVNEFSSGNLRKQFNVANKLCDGLGVNRIVNFFLKESFKLKNNFN
jgi:UDP-2,4-diacetamido-2,4,6-trideoxy-beta-L-altropyranose hydrolase